VADANGGRAPASTTGRGMGRGLGAILPERREELGLREIAVELIRPNAAQPRREFVGESLLALAESVEARGILQPLVVRPLAGGSFELIAGERRLRAATIAGLERVPAVVRETEDGERLELALIENMAREDLNAVDEARACATLVEDLGLTKEELGRRVGRSRAAVANLIRLLDLPDEALGLIEGGELSEGHGRAILFCKDHSARRRLARAAAANGWSVRETERQARDAESGADDRAGPGLTPAGLAADRADALATAEDALSAALGREVRLRSRGQSWRVEFTIEDLQDAAAIAERIAATAQDALPPPNEAPVQSPAAGD